MAQGPRPGGAAANRLLDSVIMGPGSRAPGHSAAECASEVYLTGTAKCSSESSPGGSTHVSGLWVLCLRLWNLLRLMLAVNSTVLSDSPGLKHFDFEFVIPHSPRQLVAKNTVVQQDDGLQSFFRPIASTQPSCRVQTRQETHRVNISTDFPGSEVSDMSCKRT